LISGVSENPTWSVMVPVYNRTRYLLQSLDSVVGQAGNRCNMQVEVVDDCSTEADVGSLVRGRYGDRVCIFRQPTRVGMAANWNTCIQRSRGSLIHILHQDDFVEDGYYREIEALANKYPDVGLYATRTFFVDDESIVTGITDRVRELEQPSRAVEPFLYQTPIQCAGVTVRRSSYEVLGGFRLDMGYVTDCEMWARVATSRGAVVSPKIKASYRVGDGTETSRSLRTAEGLKDIARLNELFATKYSSFSVERGRARVSNTAWQLYRRYRAIGDDNAAEANWKVWMQATSLVDKMIFLFGRARQRGLARSAFHLAANWGTVLVKPRNSER
jgi:glycosyltransferase involved in cell wall biosynthesis